jgi:hypothetical protein
METSILDHSVVLPAANYSCTPSTLDLHSERWSTNPPESHLGFQSQTSVMTSVTFTEPLDQVSESLPSALQIFVPVEGDSVSLLPATEEVGGPIQKRECANNIFKYDFLEPAKIRSQSYKAITHTVDVDLSDAHSAENIDRKYQS